MRALERPNCRSASFRGKLWQAVVVLDLDDFLALVDHGSAAWSEAGAQWTMDRSPDDGRNKHSAWVTIRHEDREGQLIVWDSGEAELEAGGPSEPLIQRHFDGLTSAVAPLADVVALVVRGPK